MNNVKYRKIIKHLSDSLVKKTNSILKAENLSMTQSILIRLLSEEENEELPIKIIEKKFGAAQSSVYGVVSRLESKGLVSTYSVDRNTKIVKLTELGLSKIDFILASVNQIEDEIFIGFTEAEKTTFTELLKRADDNLR